MHRVIICIVVVFLLPASASARVFPILSYDDLFKAADVVAIVKVTKVEATKARLEGEGDPSWYQGKAADATVGLMLKGGAQKTLSFQFFNYRTTKQDNVYLLDGPMFPDLSKAGKVHYLVFLKKTADGVLTPVTNYGNSAGSVSEVAPQGVEIKTASEDDGKKTAPHHP